MTDLDGLKQFASTRQLEYIDAIEKHGSMRKAAAVFGVNKSTIADSINRLRVKATSKGFAPGHDLTKVVPDPFIVKGVSSYYNKDGNLSGQWVKSQLDSEKLHEAVKAAIEAMADEMPRAKVSISPESTNKHLCNLYTFTDCHVGMRAWKSETGENWDLSIAERTLISAFSAMIESAPAAECAVVNQLGDFLHYDSLAPVTPLHGNILDADGRYAKVIKVAVRILRSIIDRALERHSRVVVIMAEGNHDMASSVWLRHLFGLLYENDQRVTVIDSEMPYYSHQHGETMLAFHHGHLQKNAQLPLLFAAQFPKVWGSTTKRYCHTGHRHHTEEIEHAGMTVIQHPTIAARDAYASRHGYVAERSMTAITYHSKFGQVARNTVVPEMFEG